MAEPIRLPFERYANLIAPIVARVERAPERRTLVFVDDDGTEHAVSLADLHDAATTRAAALRAAGLAAGDVLILVMGHSRALIDTFLGALCLGALPTIFPYLTEKLDPTIYAERVRALVAGVGARAVVTGASFRVPMQALIGTGACRVLDDDALSAATGATTGRAAGLDDPAYLQFTSGTGGLPKAVAHTHGALLRYIEAGLAIDPFTADDVIVSWLPLYHDLGLVTGLLIPLVLGVPTVLMSPFRWVRDPKVLFRAIHAHRGTHAWMPNFALNHCAQLVRDRDLEGIDLSGWKSLICGGETVRRDSQQQFLERFRRYGFADGTLQSGYGMAENVCAATTTERGRPPRVDWVRSDDLERAGRAVPAAPESAHAIPMTSCGPPFPGTEVRIVDDAGRRCAERVVGEIELRGRYLFCGYYRRPELDVEVFRDGWFRTGDLGYLADGRLYVCGRRSDRIIVGGRNLNPEEIEHLAGAAAGVIPGRAVAFGIPSARTGTEGVALVCEVAADLDAAAREALERYLRERAARELDLSIAAVRLVERGWVIKTSNGKIAHAANRDKYLRESAPA